MHLMLFHILALMPQNLIMFSFFECYVNRNTTWEDYQKICVKEKWTIAMSRCKCPIWETPLVRFALDFITLPQCILEDCASCSIVPTILSISGQLPWAPPL
ncbi:hypothetical protein GDO78_002167 [Eleutherodactylus coqui]|uniref:Secreted protein n=1 Tax=Eleutherodactylus coqui TaxID=57060 RepID=A0A8J6KPG6_ELECQ|nr:hypothetical protein GDO78_002167 [Eleutherodactylus coqui]